MKTPPLNGPHLAGPAGTPRETVAGLLRGGAGASYPRPAPGT